jgi:hexosaminidase
VGAFLLDDTEAYAFEVSPQVPGSKVHYTKDGSTPTENSPEAPSKISVYPTGDEIVTIKSIVVLPSGRKSNVYAATFLRGKMREPDMLAESKPGVNYELVVPAGEGAGEETRLTGETRGILLTQFEKRIELTKPFSLTYDGYFKVPADGVYEFQVESTWDPAVVLGGKTIIEGPGTAESRKRNALVPLKAGLHKISLRYNHRGGPPNFRFRWGIKGQGLNQAYGGEFVH